MIGAQETPLYSVDGTVYIEVLADGTFAIFDTASGNIAYLFSGASPDTSTPFSLHMQTVRWNAIMLTIFLPLWPAISAAHYASKSCHGARPLRPFVSEYNPVPCHGWQPLLLG